MDQAFDPLNLLILAIAVVIFFRLRSVLGRRTGNERPPFDPFAARRRNNGEAAKPGRPEEAPGNVISLPRDRASEAKPQDAEPAAPVWAGYAEEGSVLAKGLERIAAADRDFSPASFLGGAKLAYEMIVTAFAQGDKPTLKNLLSREVYDGFAGAIDNREKAGEKLESRFVGIDKAELVSADLTGRRAVVTVKFVSELISSTTNRAGEVIDGDPKQIREITDVWTFERDVASRDPNWKLVATESPA
ncbi:MAG: Tim44 domain-containing protein [Rhizobiales bacterium]|nr:Tim44 domain-containing protein [Hyphomicrobiales bacterium]